MKNAHPTVLLVGRTNVGKSTLFNHLSESIKSITYDQPGVTRDFISDVVTWNSHTFNLIDTGGLTDRATASIDPLIEQVQEIVAELIQKADLILFMVDGSVGVLAQDRKINSILFKNKIPVMLIVNKTDTAASQEHSHEFYQLGHGEPLYISAQHAKGTGDVLDAIVEHLEKMPQKTREIDKPAYSVTLLGKPNVGKSSLMNLLLKQERSLVSDIAGTTREAIHEPIVFHKETLEIIDTPGIRRKRGVTEKLEQMMVQTAFLAIQKSDIILLLIDGSSGQLSDQELKLAFYTFKEYKALILLVNKNDLIEEYATQTLQEEFSFYDNLFKKIPHLFISCKDQYNIGKIIPLVNSVWQKYSQTFDPHELNDLLRDALANKPHYHQSRMLILYKAEQVKTSPITIILKVNESEWFGESQLSFFENVMRAKYDLAGVPIRFLLRKRYKS